MLSADVPGRSEYVTSSGSFLFKVTPVARQGFLAKIALESSIAVSGIIRQSADEVYDSYSSPIYKVTLGDDGVSVTNIEIDSSSYFFTDIDGRFILSDLKSGLYMIDLNVRGQWYAAFFEVPSVETPGYVAIYKEFDASTIDITVPVTQKYDIKTFDDSYAGSVYFDLDTYMTEDDYWNLLFSLSNFEEEEFWDEEWLDDDDYFPEETAAQNTQYEQVVAD